MSTCANAGQIRRWMIIALTAMSLVVGVNQAVACEGKFLLKFGGDWSGAGKLDLPGDVAVDSKGNVWVLDAGHNRVQKFNSSGEFLLQFGSSLPLLGSLGSGNGQLSSAKGIAIDSEDDVWVASNGVRVQEFSSEGAFKQSWSVPSMSLVAGIAIDSAGKVWVSGSSSSVPKVKKLTTAGETLIEFGEKGTGNGQFGTSGSNGPQDIAADSEGNVLVADTYNNRVQEFNSSGEFVRKYGSEGSENGQFRSPAGLTVDSEGRVWVSDTNNDRVQRFSSKGSYQTQFGSGGPNDGQFDEPQGIAVDSSGNVWVADSRNDRVQKFNSSTSFLLKFGGDWSGAGKLASAGDLTFDSKGNVWVADAGHNRVQKFNSSGELLLQFGSSGPGSGQFTGPSGITVDSEDDVWVASGDGRVLEFSSEGAFKQSWSAPSMTSLAGIAIDSAGKVWVVGLNSSNVPKVKKLTTAGETLIEFGEKGTANGQFGVILNFLGPQDIAADSEGNVLVADTNNNRVQEFNSSGEFVRKYGSEGSENGQFRWPTGLTVDSEGRVWVSDTNNDRVQRFSSKGAYQTQFGSGGANDGQFDLPQGIEIDSSGNIWVADGGNDRVQKFECL